MSKLLISLINQECMLKSEDGIWFNGNADLKCKILEVDDEWVKLSFINKKKVEIKLRLLEVKVLNQLILFRIKI